MMKAWVVVTWVLKVGFQNEFKLGVASWTVWELGGSKGGRHLSLIKLLARVEIHCRASEYKTYCSVPKPPGIRFLPSMQTFVEAGITVLETMTRPRQNALVVMFPKP